MKTNIQDIAAIIATTIWADGEYDAAEKEVVSEIADAFELNADEFEAAVNSAVAAVEPMNEEEVNAYILEHSGEVEDEEAEIILQAVLQVITVDGVIGVEEVDNFLSIASALGVDDSRAVLMLADIVKDEPELEIEY
jgi:tellurite resistance protein